MSSRPFFNRPALGVTFLLALCTAARATTVWVTLDSNFAPPDYEFYSYTDTGGAPQSSIPVGPYIAAANGGGYDNATVYLYCYDFNNPTDVGTTYSGTLETASASDPNLTAELEATYLINYLDGLGGINAPLSDRGPISMAIWEIMYPSSNNNSSPFPADPAAEPWETQAAQAVANNTWTIQNADQYPTWVPDDPSVQRFGGFIMNDATPEPGSLLLIGSGLLAFGMWRGNQRHGVNIRHTRSSTS